MEINLKSNLSFELVLSIKWNIYTYTLYNVKQYYLNEIILIIFEFYCD